MPKILKTTLEHALGIHDIEVESFSDPWSIESIKHEITSPNSVCFVAVLENKTIGHVSMRHIIDEGHINNIAVSKSNRQNGVGSLLLGALIKEAINRQITALTLEVRASNTAAISLYQKYGFEIYGYRKNYYTLPTEDAAIMWKKLDEKINLEVHI